MTEENQHDEILTPDEVAAILRVHPKTLMRMRQATEAGDPQGPHYQRLGHRTVRYTRSAVMAYLRGE